ncbi:deoxyribonuclease NucA/NucB-domain-containing protein [Macrophomina phaseolina]|uniref:Deoxyribonuclease NucA/NucB-domain-containing protein n=1 Tax=Macrophomina phaseolina TaxID=35725 RepID=A0ABQ8GNG1_9PEZI|nr:deoxyribonuclease NucA/NucB-domain-containing protein [Macrophomina phaseolina]
MRHYLFFLAAAALIDAQNALSGGQSGFDSGPADIPTFNWDCSKSPRTCDNFCFHIRCRGQHVLPLTYDADYRNRPKRRQASGAALKPCVNYPVLRGPDGSGNSCDDFPWAFTQQGGTAASLKCVPLTDNNDQGDQTSTFRKSLSDGQQFDVSLTNFQNSLYCLDPTDFDNPRSADPTYCQNDGSQFLLQDGVFYYATSIFDVDQPQQQDQQQQQQNPQQQQESRPQELQRVQARRARDNAYANRNKRFFRRYMDENGMEHLHLAARDAESLVGRSVITKDGEVAIVDEIV